MQIDLSALPDDAATLQLMLRAVMLQQGELAAENDKLRLLIQRLTQHQFGRRSEQLTPDQLQLALEELEQTIAANQAGQDAAAAAAGLTRKPRAEAPARNHGALPAHLPRYEVVVDIEDHACSCCGHALHPIGELTTEQLDMVPSQLRVRVTRRPRYACHRCQSAVVVAPAPDRLVDGGMPTEALIAHVVVSKFADSLPLYRKVQMLERQGIKLDRSTLANWVFLDGGRVEMDTNVVERAIRPNTLTRKNALFAGSDGGAKHRALAMTLIQTAKLNGVAPLAWLTDVLERIVSGRTKAHEMHTLLPWTWAAANPGSKAERLAA